MVRQYCLFAIVILGTARISLADDRPNILLKNDPNELQSVYNKPEHARLVSELKQRLDDLRTKYKDDGPVVGSVPSKKKKAA